jgi:hypothetical protein
VVVAAAKNMLAALPRVLAVVRADDMQVARALGALVARCASAMMPTRAWPLRSPAASRTCAARRAG